MNYEHFDAIYNRACDRFGTESALKRQLVKPKSPSELAAIGDDRWLATFTQKVFQSGMNWKVVNNKWANFETAFFGFDIEKMLLIHDEMWEEKAKDPSIIRHLGKVMTIRENAIMIAEIQEKYGSFSQFVADFPCDAIIDLWATLKFNGARLGGNTGPYALRMMGKDSFLLTRDVEGYLRNQGIITTGRETQSAKKSAQQAFNHWQRQSSLPYSQISQCIAFGVN